MRGITKRIGSGRIIAGIMTGVMVCSLCAGLFYDHFSGVEIPVMAAPAQGVQTPVMDVNTGIYAEIPSNASAAKGTSENPFVVLEIVPDRDMAQFGYLVGGQEPVDLDSEYGYFERVNTAPAPGEKRYDFSDVSMEFCEVEEGVGDYVYDRVTMSNYLTVQPDVSAAFANYPGVTKWVEVAEGTGLYSSELYKYEGPGAQNAEYSLKKKKTEHGELDYIGGLGGVAGETGQAERTFSSDNTINVQNDGWFSNTYLNINDYIVTFRLAKPGTDDGRKRYSVKQSYSGKGNFMVYWGVENSEVYRNYVLKDNNGNYVLADENDEYVLATKNGDYAYDSSGKKIPVSYDDCHFEFTEVENTKVSFIERIYSAILGKTLPYTSIHYMVIFEQDDNGKYVVDTAELFDFDEEIGYIHVASTYNITDIGATHSAWGPATMTNGLYNGQYTDISAETGILPQYVGTYSEAGQTVYLGEYVRSQLTEYDVVSTSNLGSGYTGRDIGNRDYDKYVLKQQAGGDVALRFCYTMVEKTGGAYVWHGNKDSSGHVLTPSEVGLDSLTLRSSREIDLSDSAYDRFGASATLGIWNGGYDHETGHYKNTELFKKYGIGLAYVDGEIAKGVSADRDAVEELVAAYDVRVITVTPDDLKNRSSAETAAHKAETNIDRLVKRADLIVINSTPNSTGADSLRGVWSMKDGVSNAPFRNTMLFPDGSLTGASTFLENDLTADAADAIFAKIGGYGTDEICPVVYDYSIFSSVEALPDSNASVKTVTMTSRFADNMAFSKSARGYDNNAYKLFLLSQQMNPITLYNAYKSEDSIVYDDPVLTCETRSSKRVFRYTGSSTISVDASIYWNKYTLVPYASMTLTDWALGQDSTLKALGVTLDPELGTKQSLVRNRLFSYNYICSDGSAANLVTGFNTPMYPSDAEEKLNEFLYPEGENIPTFYKTRDIIYYLVNSAEVRTNFSKALEILEIEPSDGFRAEPYWFWYVSRFVPNYTGSYHVSHMSSSEFIGSVEDLNSTYDIVYIGGEINSNDIIKDYLDADATGSVPAGGDIVVPVTQYINFNFSKAMVTNYRTKYRIMCESAYEKLTAEEKEGYERQEAIKLNFKLWENQYAGIYGHVTLAQTDLGEYGVMLGLEAVKNMDNYYYASASATGFNELTGIVWATTWKGVGLKATLNTLLVDPESKYGGKNDDALIKWEDDEKGRLSRGLAGTALKKGDFYLNPFYVKEVKEGVAVSGVSFDAGTKVYAGERITNDESRAQTYLVTNYCYAHTGGKVTLSGTNSRQGLLNTTSTSDSVRDFAYSGDDITALKMNELYRFAQAGYPVIISRDLIDAGGHINVGMVDDSSYMYTFLTSMLSDEYIDVGFVDNDTTKDAQFIKALNCKNFKLNVVKAPVKYEEYQSSQEYSDLLVAKAAGTASEDDWKNLYKKYYINGVNVDDTTLKFTVRIDTDSDHDYELRLYVDLNANGRYDETDERLDSLEIESVAEGIHVAYNRLKGNTTYLIRRHMMDYVGPVPWKLEIFDVNNPNVKDEVKGISAIRVEEKKRINVLQITVDSGGTIYFPTDEEITAAENNHKSNGVVAPITVSNMATYFGNGAITTAGSCKLSTRSASDVTDEYIINGTGMLYYYIHSMNEFDVHFYRITVSDMDSLVDGTKLSTNRLYGNGDIILKKGSTETKMDMVVLGFADSFTDIRKEKSRSLIKSFTEAGNTALFTHDITSLNTRTSSGNPYGYNMNKEFRELFGMDRYNVTTNHGDMTQILSATDVPWKLGSGATEVLSSGTRALAQGLTNWNLDVACRQGDSVSQSMTTVIATKANDGQIVQYPYDMSKVEITGNAGAIEIARTHGQYFQLDMEDDRMVVWYCLGYNATDNRNTKAYLLKNDVRNNYYIYNVGNVIYSGIGHNQRITEAEAKLFVNTIAYSYMAGAGTTTATVLNADKVTASGSEPVGGVVIASNEYLYVDYDATSKLEDAKAFGTGVSDDSAAGHPERQYLNVYFKLTNYSAAVGKRFVVRTYPVVTVTQNGVTKEVVLSDCPLELPVYVENESGTDETHNANFSLYFRSSSTDLTGVQYAGAEAVQARTCYVRVPLYSKFYQDIWDKINKSGSEYRNNRAAYDQLKNFAFLPANSPDTAKDVFTISLDVVMFYGSTERVNSKTMYRNEPVEAETRVHVVRRGMFLLD